MPPIKVILNPTAGRGRGAKIEVELREHLGAQGLDIDLVQTQSRGHAIELAERAKGDGFETVVAAGGDGTTQEVVNGLLNASDGQPTGTLGVIPVGSGSDFSYAMGIPPDLGAACERLAGGQLRVVDIGRLVVDEGPARYFDNTLGLGFDAVVTVETQKVKWLRGMALYLPVVFKTVFLSLKIPNATVVFDDQEMSLPALMITVANGPREGGGFLVAPDAQPDDGFFDLCLVNEVSRPAMLGLIPHFIQGTHVDREPVTMRQARRVAISSVDDLVAHADGEVLCTDGHRIEAEILPQRLSVVC